MCVGDWRLARLIRSQVRNFTTTNGTPVVIPASMQRVGVNISYTDVIPLNTNYIKVSFDGVQTFLLTAGIQFVHFDFWQFGDLPTHTFTVSANTDAVKLTIIEWFLPEDVLSAALQSFWSDYGQWVKQH